MLCLLALSLWRAPIPWLDAHGTLGGDGCHIVDRMVSKGVSGLDAHLLRYHPGVDPFSVQQLGWHVHFVLPWEGLEQHRHRSPQDPHDFAEPLASSDVVSSAPAPLLLPDRSVVHCSSGALCPALFASVPTLETRPFPDGLTGREFLGTYGAGVTLRALLGVAVC